MISWQWTCLHLEVTNGPACTPEGVAGEKPFVAVISVWCTRGGVPWQYRQWRSGP